MKKKNRSKIQTLLFLNVTVSVCSCVIAEQKALWRVLFSSLETLYSTGFIQVSLLNG